MGAGPILYLLSEGIRPKEIFELNPGVLLRNFQTEVYCLRSIILAEEVYFLAQYQYICAIFIVVLAMTISPDLLL